MNARRPTRPQAPARRGRRTRLDVRLLIASGAIDAVPVPSLWRGLLAFLLQPSPFMRAPWGATTQFAESTQQGGLS